MKVNIILVVSCLIALCFLFPSCKTAKSVEELTDADIRVSMSKGGCFGKCPIYSIDIYQGGYAKYFGERHAEKLGLYDKQLSKETYNALIKAFQNSSFFTYQDFYESNVPDAPSVSISFTNKKEQSKTIKGKLDRPDELIDLQLLIEEIASSKGWNLLEKLKEEPVKEKVKESSKPYVIKSEIIIEPKPGVALSKWFAEKKKLYGVRIINKVSPNSNMWLITYDQKMVDGDMLLQILQDDPNILNAEFNKKTSERGGR